MVTIYYNIMAFLSRFFKYLDLYVYVYTHLFVSVLFFPGDVCRFSRRYFLTVHFSFFRNIYFAIYAGYNIGTRIYIFRTSV